MELYSVLAGIYEDIFPVSDQYFGYARTFVSGMQNGFIDLGCGTGELCRKLSKKNHEQRFSGIDLSSDMIDLAQKRSNGNLNDYFVADMRMPELMRQVSYDRIFCAGNTWAHLTDPEEAIKTASVWRELSADKSKISVMILNYDKLLKEKPAELPPINIPRWSFQRNYEYQKNAILFMISLHDLKEEKVYDSWTRLYPFTSAEMMEIFTLAGWKNLVFKGSFKGDSFDEDSPLCILEGEK